MFPFSNYKKVSISTGNIISGTVLYTNPKDAYISFDGLTPQGSGNNVTMITVGNSEQRILFSRFPLSVDNNEKEAATYGGRGLVFVGAGETVSYTSTVDAVSSPITGILRIFEIG